MRLVSRLASLHNQKSTETPQDQNFHRKSTEEKTNVKNTNQIILKDLTNPLDNNNSKNESGVIITTGTKKSTPNNIYGTRSGRTTKENIKSDNNSVDEEKNNMGSNVSRHTGKGLSGRRTQSSGIETSGFL